MPAYEIISVNHTSFTVSDLDRSIRFFSDCLKFHLVSREGRDVKTIERIVGVPGAEIEVAYLRGAGHVVELIQYHKPSDRPSGRQNACDPGFAHLAFDVRNIDAVIRTAVKHGFSPLSDPVKTAKGGPNAGYRVCYLRDGDGVTIELIEKE